MLGAVATTRVSIRLSDEAHQGWDREATRNGVTLTALIEALGQALCDGKRPIPATILDAARAIDFERRSRR